MNPAKIIGIILIVGGCLGLAYGGISYTRDSTALRIGPMEINVQERKTIAIPLIASAAAVALGIFLLVGVGRK